MNKNFDQVRQRFEEHLEAINENTSEIQAMLDYLQVIESKVDKLNQRMDLLQIQEVKYSVEPLTQTEKKIFLTLYTEQNPLTFQEIAIKAQLIPSIVSDHVSSMVHKGVPLQRSTFNNRLFFKLDPGFKELQAKENLVNLSLQSFIN